MKRKEMKWNDIQQVSLEVLILVVYHFISSISFHSIDIYSHLLIDAPNVNILYTFPLLPTVFDIPVSKRPQTAVISQTGYALNTTKSMSITFFIQIPSDRSLSKTIFTLYNVGIQVNVYSFYFFIDEKIIYFWWYIWKQYFYQFMFRHFFSSLNQSLYFYILLNFA